MSESMGRASTVEEAQEYMEVSDAVIFAVAEAENVSPLELSPLTHAIDPDALNSFVGSLTEKQSDSFGYIEFEYRSHTVNVSADGHISLE